jgi:hypothetical protein
MKPKALRKLQTMRNPVFSMLIDKPVKICRLTPSFLVSHSKARLCISLEDSSRMVSAMLQRPIILTDLDLFDEAKK